MANRMSMYSMASEPAGRPSQPNSQVSATTLLNAIHNIYLSGQPYQLDAGTSVVVNTWLTASQAGSDGRVGGTIDTALASRVWEHARRRAEDGCVVLGSLHNSTPSLLTPFLLSMPCSVPSIIFRGLEALQPFLRCVTPFNPSLARQSALAVALTLNLGGEVVGVNFALSQSGIDTKAGLLNVPAEAGYRAFDVFYYLLTSASTPAEREFLGLKTPNSYELLSRSGTYDPPSYLPTADDAAAAEDFRSALKDVGIKGANHRNLISILAGLLKLGNTLDYSLDSDELENICEDVSGLLGIDPEILITKCSTEDRPILIGGLYEALVDWVIARANKTMNAQISHMKDGIESVDGRSMAGPIPQDDGDTVKITIVEIPDIELGKAIALRGIFDDSQGINQEMIRDGVEVPSASSSIVREVGAAVAAVGPDLGDLSGSAGRDRERDLEKREIVLERVALAVEDDGFLKKLLFPNPSQGINLGREGRFEISSLLNSSRVWYHLSIHPTDESPASLAALPSVNSAWSAGVVSRQLRSWRLPEWANRRNKSLDFTADFDIDEFVQRFATLGCGQGREGIENWLMARSWSNGEVVVGKERVWMREIAWWGAESMLDMKPAHSMRSMVSGMPEGGFPTTGSYYPPPMESPTNGSREQLLDHQRTFSQGNMSQMTLGNPNPNAAPSIAPSAMRNVRAGDYGLGNKGDVYQGEVYYNEEGQFIGGLDTELAEGKQIETTKLTKQRRIWVAIVWGCTWWIPSPLLRWVGRMHRPDVRQAWREKFVLVWFILLLNALVLFLIIGLGNVLCPNKNKVWDIGDVSGHTASNDFYVAIHGSVYDISKFWKLDHGTSNVKVTTSAMQPLAGLDLTAYFPIPIYLTCPNLVSNKYLTLQHNNTESVQYSNAMHTSGDRTNYANSGLTASNWYWDTFLPTMKEYYKGRLVYTKDTVKKQANDDARKWFWYKKKLYDLTDYFYTLDLMAGSDAYEFLNTDLTSMIEKNTGTDITSNVDKLRLEKATNATALTEINESIDCIINNWYMGVNDFRDSPRCQVINYMLLAFTIIVCATILVKFLAALQFGSKKRPQPQDKFVICQVPAYTEGEDSLRKAIDSLTALQYDNKRKLICIVCDGIIVGQGNDRPTPKIVLDILGVDPKVDPPALPFKSIGTGAEQLNYGKVYSGLYEFEGNVVPYLVVVKVGKESEQALSKPGNRGKRDSQILLMSFLNRVHHRSPMNPLELEMFHQVNNIIGVDPELYEYILMVDADTSVREDSLNRLVAACANDAKIAGICGETALENDEKTWWTMIQVYEYYISHHLAKAFESLFGSVTCLPGCFSMYRLRTPDKRKPLIISNDVIRDYSICDVDTLHKKNLLSLGEDRYLTTLMTKYFPTHRYKFIPDAYCQTAAPESWAVLLSQRRRWINSTIHNLFELVQLKEMCGFCCFSMRFVVMLDLCSTIILPATMCYLGYLLYLIIGNHGPFPLISVIMIAAVYGLQALIFILKRQWQHIGWMIIYILALPVYSFILPVYSFWNQDNFSWGNTRIVVGEKGDKKIVAASDGVFDPRSIPLQRWDDYAMANNLPGRRGYADKEYYADDQYEMDEMKSVYSAVPPGSILGGGMHRNSYMPPSPSFVGRGQYQDHPMNRHSMASVGASPYQDGRTSAMGLGASTNRLSSVSPGLGAKRSSAMLRSPSAFDFQTGATGPDDLMIVEAIQGVLREVDLDTVTKKQVRALVEQRLQTELAGERRAFMDRQIDTELANM
ncbi:Chitin synthase 6 [Ceratocystis fimbriata CBS 114723]|uniref:chitin synthase n=1 Tax=Ceratocystis fimbriata CBS 114723 TaxID=1035309 RepID=A0A2C5XI75_9PEZI|nr:Chitin synthase 6 [Ceratocystis fimbriata CBS 114723]